MKSIKPLFFLIVTLFVAAALGQEDKMNIFADPQNLKVLPEDISSDELSDTMMALAMGLGVRCSNCHVGEPEAPLDTYDFQSDEKAMKRKARVMFRMVQEINAGYVSELDKIEKSPRVEVRCVTCHRGQPKPKLIEDVLDEQLAENGVDAAVTEYNNLRENYYGSHSYDFSEFTLPMYAQELATRDDVAAAIAFAKINIEYFPESYYSHFALAELYESVEQNEKAIDNYERAAELNARAKPFLDAKIAELKDQARRYNQK